MLTSTEALARVTAMYPGFHPVRPLRRTIKCVLIEGELDGVGVVAKVLAHDDPVWRWYFDREVRVYATLPPGVAAPTLRAAAGAAGVMILSRLDGHELARGRQATRGVDRELTAALLEVIAALDRWEWDEPSGSLPSVEVLRAMRRRLLEDPTAPLAWFLEGFERCAELGIVTGGEATALGDALRAYPETAPCHGDLLPRNVIVGPTGVALVDWECAGRHARDWDRALVWVALPRPHRDRVAASVAAASPERRAAFTALTAFALARQLAFSRRSRQGRRRELEALLRHQLDSLARRRI